MLCQSSSKGTPCCRICQASGSTWHVPFTANAHFTQALARQEIFQGLAQASSLKRAVVCRIDTGNAEIENPGPNTPKPRDPKPVLTEAINDKSEFQTESPQSRKRHYIHHLLNAAAGNDMAAFPYCLSQDFLHSPEAKARGVTVHTMERINLLRPGAVAAGREGGGGNVEA